MTVFRLPSSKHNVNLWAVPLKVTLAAILLFAFTVTLDALAAHHVIQIPDWFTMGGIDDARAILSAMLGCVSTVLALIFSVALLVLSMVANLFGPRLLYRFVQDWVTQACIGLFMGAFMYVFLVFLVTHKDEHTEFIPQISLITSWFLVLGAFGFLVFYSHRVAVLIQNPDAIGRIVDDLRRAVRIQVRARQGDHHLERPDDQSQWNASDHALVSSAASGYLQTIDHDSLVAAASRAGALITVQFRPGQFVLEGDTIAIVAPASAQASLAQPIAHCISLGRHRVLAQDLEFGIAQIVEIAIRALSPAINDTFTGIACVDFLGEGLSLLAEAAPFGGAFRDREGQLRLRVRRLLLSRLVKQAFDQIRQAAADNPAVLIRLLSTISRLVPKMQADEDRRSLEAQAAAVWETANTKVLVQMDRADIEFHWQKVLTHFPSVEYRS